MAELETFHSVISWADEVDEHEGEAIHRVQSLVTRLNPLLVADDPPESPPPPVLEAPLQEPERTFPVHVSNLPQGIRVEEIVHVFRNLQVRAVLPTLPSHPTPSAPPNSR
jgi:hypothetical protein